MSGDMNSEAFRLARNALIDARNGDVCGGPLTGCEQDGETAPGPFGNECVDLWIDHGPECPVTRSQTSTGVDDLPDASLSTPSAQKGTPDLTASTPDLAVDVVGTTGPSS